MPGMTHAAGASAPKACWSGPELLQHPGLQAGNCAYVILERASHQLALHEAVMNEGRNNLSPHRRRHPYRARYRAPLLRIQTSARPDVRVARAKPQSSLYMRTEDTL